MSDIKHRYLFRELASLLVARENCKQSGNTEWFDKHEETINRLVKDHMPSGSGIDRGTKLDWDRSKQDKLVFYFGYHHMNEGGFYSGWTEHTAIVTPSLMSEYELRITGRNRNDVKEYLHETFEYALCIDLYDADHEYRQFAIERGYRTAEVKQQ